MVKGGNSTHALGRSSGTPRSSSLSLFCTCESSASAWKSQAIATLRTGKDAVVSKGTAQEAAPGDGEEKLTR